MTTAAETKAASILRQLANTAVEQAQLARDLDLPGGGCVEDELAKLWRHMSSAVENGLMTQLGLLAKEATKS